MQKVVINKLNPNLNLQKFIVDTGDEDVSVMATNKDSAMDLYNDALDSWEADEPKKENYME